MSVFVLNRTDLEDNQLQIDLQDESKTISEEDEISDVQLQEAYL